MSGFTIKLISGPIVMIAADYLTRSISYSAIWQPATVGLFLAFTSYILDQLLLGRKTFWLTTFLDFIFVAMVVYASQWFLANAAIGLIGSLFAAAIFAAFEYITHWFLLRTGRIE